MSRRCRKDWRKYHSQFDESRQSGWNRNLYRNTKEGMIGGVCAGVGDYFGIAHWIIRLATVLLFFALGGIMLPAYIIMWIVMSPRPEDAPDAKAGSVSRGKPQSVRLLRAQQSLAKATARVEAMEAYITSRHYELDREFAKIDK